MIQECDQCGNNGECISVSCNKEYYLSASGTSCTKCDSGMTSPSGSTSSSSCVPKKETGTCTFNSDCMSGSCKGNICCATGTGCYQCSTSGKDLSDCIACDPGTGACTTCKSGSSYYLEEHSEPTCISQCLGEDKNDDAQPDALKRFAQCQNNLG